MTTIGYPTSDFPAPLPFALELPTGWLGTYVPGTLVAGFKPSSTTDSFHPNVIVIWQRATVDSSAGAIAKRALELALLESPLLETVSNKVADGDTDFQAVYTLLRNDRGNDFSLFHARLTVVGPPLGTMRDVYQIVGTYPSGDESAAEDVEKCLMSFSLALPASPTR